MRTEMCGVCMCDISGDFIALQSIFGSKTVATK